MPRKKPKPMKAIRKPKKDKAIVAAKNEPTHAMEVDEGTKEKIPKIKLLNCVVKGLPEDSDISAVKKELAELGIKPIKVEKFRQRRKIRINKLIFLSMENTENSYKAYGCSELLGQKVKIEPFRQKRRVIQCFKCQKFGHLSYSCTGATKCVICSGSHKAKDCTNRDKTPKCANCEGCHVSSYKGCPKVPRMPKAESRKKPSTCTKCTQTEKVSTANAATTSKPAMINSEIQTETEYKPRPLEMVAEVLSDFCTELPEDSDSLTKIKARILMLLFEGKLLTDGEEAVFFGHLQRKIQNQAMQ